MKKINFFLPVFFFLFTISSLPVDSKIGNELLKMRSSSVKVDQNSPGFSAGKVLNFNLYVERINQNWENGAWVNDSRDIDNWNPSMTQVEVLEQEWVNDKWENKTRHLANVTVNMADSSLNFNNFELFTWNGLAWVLQMRSDYIYDSNNHLIQVNSQMSMGGTLIPFQQIDYVNNTAGNPLTETLKQINFQTMQMQDYRKWTLTYNPSNLNYLETELSAYYINSSWVDTNKTTYTRNSWLNELTVLYQDIYGGTNIVNTNFEEMSYDPSGENRTQSIYKYWNSLLNIWEISSRWTATYDASWNMTLELGENYMNGNYVPSWRSSYTYNTSGDVTLSQTEFFTSTEGWELTNQSIFYYSPSGVSGDLSNPDAFTLSRNYPNPFNPSTIISYSLPFASDVKLTIYDVLGNQVAELVNGFQPAGSYNVTFNAAGLSSGVYFYKLLTSDFSSVKQMMLIK